MIGNRILTNSFFELLNKSFFSKLFFSLFIKVNFISFSISIKIFGLSGLFLIFTNTLFNLLFCFELNV